jgi:hypothetical protein
MTAALEQVGRRAVATPQTIGQQTAVEQARAVAEVAAAVQVARQFPRDLDRVRAEMQRECSDYDLAREAFYAVDNRGTGPSVHLARELARIWGNFQSGVHELRRDDDAGESEVQAFAWDVRDQHPQPHLFISPHQTDEGRPAGPAHRPHDIYLNNQNTGARALRECIFASLPKWLVRGRAAVPRHPRSRPDRREHRGPPQAGHREFARGSVTEQQLVKHVGKPVDDWTPQDVAALEVLYDSLRRREKTKEEIFGDPQPSVTGAEIVAQGQQEQPPTGAKATQGQLAKIHALLRDHGIESDDAVRKAIGDILGRPPASRTTLSKVDADKVVEHLQKLPQPPAPDGGEQQ